MFRKFFVKMLLKAKKKAKKEKAKKESYSFKVNHSFKRNYFKVHCLALRRQTWLLALFFCFFLAYPLAAQGQQNENLVETNTNNVAELPSNFSTNASNLLETNKAVESSSNSVELPSNFSTNVSNSLETNNAAEPPSPSAFDSFKSSTLNISRVRSLLENRIAQIQSRVFLFKERTLNKLRQGEIKMKLPSLLRVKYLEHGTPVIDVLVSEGIFYIHLVRERMVYEQQWRSNKEITSSQRLFEPKFLLENYDFSFVLSPSLLPVFSETDAINFNLTKKDTSIYAYHLRLTPKDIRQGFSNLNLWVTAQGDIVRMQSVDIERRLVDFYFYDFRNNVFLPKNDFEFIMPVNVRVIKNLVPVENIVENGVEK